MSFAAISWESYRLTICSLNGSMTVSGIYILGPNGKVIISRDYRGDVTEAAVDRCVGGGDR